MFQSLQRLFGTIIDQSDSQKNKILSVLKNKVSVNTKNIEWKEGTKSS